MNVKEVNATNFYSSIANGAVLVDFFADWCGPCKMMSPILDELSEELDDQISIIKINIDNAQEIAMQFQVTSIPTIVFFKEGKEVDRLVGLKDKDTLKEMITT